MDKKYIAVPGRLESVATDGQIAGTNQVYDDARQKSQAAINDEFESGQSYLDNKISALQKQDVVPVDTLPAVADADPKKIYRVVGTDSYTDHMLNAAGDDFKILATYSFPGIDDEPTAGSRNFVTSGEVKKVKDISEQANGILLGKAEYEILEKPSTNAFILSLENLHIPAGTKLRIKFVGIGSVFSQYFYKINKGSFVQSNVDDIKYIVADTDIDKFYVVCPPKAFLFPGTITAEVDVYGVNTGIVEDIANLQRADKEILGEKLLDYNGFPVISDYINLTNISFPAGTRIRIKVEEGWSTAISGYTYRFNESKPVIVTSNPNREIVLTEEALSFRINGAASTVIDKTKQVKIVVDIPGIIPGIEDDLKGVKAEMAAIKKSSMVDFNTDFVIENYATDKSSKAFTDSFNLQFNDGKVNENIIVSSNAKFVNAVDDAVPTIQFTIFDNSYTHYTSTIYTIGRKDEFVRKEWRVPPISDGQTLGIAIVIPENVTLYIEEISNKYSDVVNRNALGYRMNAHLNIVNFNTYDGFVLSAKLGYPCCVCVPKRLADGVWVCYHDDGAVGTSLVDENYENLSAEEQALTISGFTYTRLKQLWYKASKGVYRKIPKLEDFLMVCSKTGMHPMFSWHPISSAEEMQEIKALVAKFGLLPYLNIKMGFKGASSVTNMNRAYNIFGNIESYTGDVNVDTDVTTIISALDSTTIDKTKVRVGLEFYNSRVTLEKVQATLNAGYFAAIAWMTSDPTSEQLEYWIKNGVTEFTEYNMVSYGLNW